MIKLYEVRNVPQSGRIEDRGTLISQHLTYTEAMTAATVLNAAGRDIYVCKEM